VIVLQMSPLARHRNESAFRRHGTGSRQGVNGNLTSSTRSRISRGAFIFVWHLPKTGRRGGVIFLRVPVFLRLLHQFQGGIDCIAARLISGGGRDWDDEHPVAIVLDLVNPFGDGTLSAFVGRENSYSIYRRGKTWGTSTGQERLCLWHVARAFE
jgi:hypothetical protein